MFATKGNLLTFGGGTICTVMKRCLFVSCPQITWVTAPRTSCTLHTAEAALLCGLAFYWPPITLPRPQTTPSLGGKMTGHLKLKCASQFEKQNGNVGVKMLDSSWNFCPACQILFQKRSQLFKYLGRVALEDCYHPELNYEAFRAQIGEIGDLCAPISNPETNGLNCVHAECRLK